MALSIKDESTDRLVRRYAKLHRTSFTGAIKIAVGDALKREGQEVEETDRERRKREFFDTVRRIQDEVKTLPILDDRHPDDILYDADGIPR